MEQRWQRHVQPAYAGGKWPIPLRSVEQFHGNTLRFVEGTPVDSIFYCAHVNQPDWEIPMQNIRVLGPHPVRHVVDFAHSHGMEFFYSIRMNDTHASYFPPKESYWPPFRLQHPELLLAGVTREEFEKKYLPWISHFLEIEKQRESRRLYEPHNDLDLQRQSLEQHPLADVIRRQGEASRDLWSWAAYDYAQPGTRDRYLEVIDRACQLYDLDGIEMDWVRMPMYFRVDQQRRGIPILNDFVHQARQILKNHGEKRGRPILLAMRVPDSLELSLSVGIDVETWARQGWFDLLMAGSGLTWKSHAPYSKKPPFMA